MKKKINGMTVELKAPNELKVGDLICYEECFIVGEYVVYILTKHVVFDGEEYFYARRVHPGGVCLDEYDESIIVGGIRSYKILNI